jgi:uncharacterized protein
MIAVDVNVLIYAISTESRDHEKYKQWLEAARLDERPLVIFELVLASVFRILTNSRIYRQPMTFNQVSSWATQLIDSGNVTVGRPGEQHWEIFLKLCQTARVSGNLVADAYLAALAIEHGCEWMTTDKDFARFPGLHWRHPLD